MMDNTSLAVVAPEILLLVMACVIALVDLGVKTRLRNVTYWLTMLTLAVVAWMWGDWPKITRMPPCWLSPSRRSPQ